MISDDTPYRLAYDSSTRALDDQARALESLRTRAGTIFAATALVTSFIGGIASYRVPWPGGSRMDDRALERKGVKIAEPAPKPTPRWPDVSKPDTRGGGGGDQKR